MKLRLLRFALFVSATGWGVSVFGVVLLWDNAAALLEGFGARPVPHDPMLDYWLRMASGAFALVGAIYLLLALQPRRFARIIPARGWLMLVEGVVLLVHGWRLGLRLHSFYFDTSFCFAAGGVIVGCANAVQAPTKSQCSNSP